MSSSHLQMFVRKECGVSNRIPDLGAGFKDERGNSDHPLSGSWVPGNTQGLLVAGFWQKKVMIVSRIDFQYRLAKQPRPFCPIQVGLLRARSKKFCDVHRHFLARVRGVLTIVRAEQ